VRRAAAAILICGLVAVAGPARADETPNGLPEEACPERFEGAAGPLAGGTQARQPADFGAVPEACAGSDTSLRLRGELVDASGAPDFFGRVIAGGTVHGRRRITARSWLSLSVDIVTVRYTNDAGLAATDVSVGPTTVGYHLTVLDGARTALAVYARALLPIPADTGRQSGFELGLELGASVRARLARRWILDGGISLAQPTVVTGGEAEGRLEPAALAEAWFSPRPRLALVGGASLRTEASPVVSLVTVAPRAGLRGTLRHGLWLAFLAEAPVAGTDRTQVTASLFLGWVP
jgi:hypothetical protein